MREARLEVGDVRRQVDVLCQRGGEGGVGCGEGGMDCWRGVGDGVEEGWVGEDFMEVLFPEHVSVSLIRSFKRRRKGSHDLSCNICGSHCSPGSAIAVGAGATVPETRSPPASCGGSGGGGATLVGVAMRLVSWLPLGLGGSTGGSWD